jgi:hypothetical protein
LHSIPGAREFHPFLPCTPALGLSCHTITFAHSNFQHGNCHCHNPHTCGTEICSQPGRHKGRCCPHSRPCTCDARAHLQYSRHAVRRAPPALQV